MLLGVADGLSIGAVSAARGALTNLGAKATAKSSANATSKVLVASTKQLQTKFKHAGNFGVTGNYNKTNVAKFSAALNKHINASGTQMINGTYRNANNHVIFHLNRQTGLNVITSPSGEFISGWQLKPEQVQSILMRNFLW